MPLLIRGSRENGCEKYFHEEYARDIIRMHVSEMLLSCQITGRIIFAGGRTMVQQPAFCRFPLSLKDCGQALVQALREHVLQQQGEYGKTPIVQQHDQRRRDNQAGNRRSLRDEWQ